jgi:hypothetical protein
MPWYLSTYGRDDSATPSLEPLWSNRIYDLRGGLGSKHNWAILVLLSGLVRFIIYRNQYKWTGIDLSWRRLIVAALTLWGLRPYIF